VPEFAGDHMNVTLTELLLQFEEVPVSWAGAEAWMPDPTTAAPNRKSSETKREKAYRQSMKTLR
jgi:hypothetical protein